MINGKKVLAITLARGGSKSVPKKNIAELAGNPLLFYTFSEVKKSAYIDDYVLSTDCPDIEAYSLDQGVSVPFRRPVEFATDEATSANALLHAVEFMISQGKNFDYIVEVMATNPLKIVEDIDGCIELLESKNADYVVACHQIYDNHPSRVKYLEEGKIRDFYPEVVESRRQDLSPSAYVRSGSVYAMKRDALVKNRARYDKSDTYAYVLPPDRVINIDEPIDFLVAESILRKK